MTSAINGRIVFKQGPRNYLEASIRRNSLVFDTDNKMLLYSPSGTNYYEFPSSGTARWENIIGKPTASSSTSGLLSVSDWIKFNNKADLSAVSSIGSVSSVGVSSNSLIVSNSPITSFGTFSVELSSITSSGTSTKVSYDQFGRIISSTNLIESDIPILLPSKIEQDISNRFVSDSQINSWSSASVSAHTHSNKSNLDNIDQNLNTSASVSFASISSINFNDINFSGGYSLVSDGLKNIVESSITSATLNYLSGTSANIQTQINNTKTLIPQTFASTNTSGLLTSSDWNTFNNKSDMTNSEVLLISTNVTTSGISSIGLIDMGDYIQTTKPLVLPNGVTFTPFVQRYVSGSPSVSSMTISASTSQRIKLPEGTTHRLWWYGVGPFAYRTGTSSVAALASDFPAMVGYTQLIITSAEYLSVYGIGAGSVVIEAGDGGLNSVESENNINLSAISTSSTTGLLTSSDWNAFNNKVDLNVLSEIISGMVQSDYELMLKRNTSFAISNALANISSVDVVCIGDSITIGVSSAFDYPWPNRVKQHLSTLYGDNVAHGWYTTNSRIYNNSPNRFSLGDGWTIFNNSSYGLAGSGALSANSPAGNLVWYPFGEDDVDTFEAIFCKNSTFGTISISATGGSPVIQNLSTSGQGVIKVVCSAGSLNKTNFLTVSATGIVYACAFRAYNSQKKQILVGNLGIGGSKSSTWAGVGQFREQNILPLMSPTLAIVAVGVNDAGGGGGLATSAYMTNMKKLCEVYLSGCDICLMSPTQTLISGSAELSREYESELRKYALEKKYKFLPVTTVFGPVSAGPGLWSGDNIHLTPKGEMVLGSIVTSIF